MNLQEQIDKQRSEIRTDAYSMSIGELISLYESKEIDIHPEFQRFFRWTQKQKTQLIESILLGIPIPPIFVSQRKNGVWDVVDGLQRLSTIYQLVGVLKDDKDELVPQLVLDSTEYLPLLKGKRWESPDNPDLSLTTVQRLIIKRAKIDISIILMESDENSKYELFMRLNTGGSILSFQEVRNSILVMLNRDLFQWMKGLTADESFQEVIALTDRAVYESYDMDLLLRFLIFRNMPEGNLSGIGDLNDFMTKQAKIMATSNVLDLREEEEAFRTTFRLLKDNVGTDCFHKFDVVKNKFSGGFLVSAYEAVALGLAYHYPSIISSPPTEIRERIKNIWVDPTFIAFNGSGVSASSRIPRTLPIGRQAFAL